MTSLKFGTSGLRGLVVDLEGRPACEWTAAFLMHCAALGGSSGGACLVGRDLRASSSGIADAAIAAIAAAGLTPVDCGMLPTPALALESARRGVPAIMVTGSHIPDDRNGLKFYRSGAEITKSDEAGILAAHAANGDGPWTFEPATARDVAADALARYRMRYLDFFTPSALAGQTVGVYQHSSVARDLLVDIIEALGASTVALARSDIFVPVDTEAHSPEDISRMATFAADGILDAIVSTDGDADRPLVADAAGTILRGDVLGLLTARRFGLRTVVTPVTSGSVVDRANAAERVVRTQVGSPYVIAAMEAEDPSVGLLGFEANGGVLLGSTIVEDGRALNALLTRDAVLPILAVLSTMAREVRSLSDLVASLRPGHALADRLQAVPADSSAAFLAHLAEGGTPTDAFFATAGRVQSIDTLDGVRVTLQDGTSVHYRVSGNAPELRCYVEAKDKGRAEELLAWGLSAVRLRLKIR